MPNQFHVLTRSEKSILLRLESLMFLFSGACIAVVFYLNSMNADKTGMQDKMHSSSSDFFPVKTTDEGVEGEASVQNLTQLVTDAGAFYNMLNTTQQSQLQLTYSTTLARKWSNLPCGTTCRNGVQLGTNLTSTQYAAAMQVCKDIFGTGTNQGYDEFHQMNLAEAYLHANGGGSGYDSTLRWMAFLNTPSETGAWMIQIGGHHYAANFSFNNGHMIGATPYFMGLEPKAFTYNSVAYDPLDDEKTAFASMLASLSSTELSTAHLSSSFSDCTMVPGETNGGTGAFPAVKVGLACSTLTVTQKNLVLDAIERYVSDIESNYASAIMQVYTDEIDGTYIAYTGSGTVGNASSFFVAQGDYVRIDGPTVWIEFSCQGGVVISGQIHYHTVWRDHDHDYGVDLTGDPIDESSTTGIETIENNQLLNIFPNPAINQITIKLPVEAEDAQILLINTTGQTLMQVQHATGSNFVYNMSQLSSGSYIIKVIENKAVYTAKFIKQ